MKDILWVKLPAHVSQKHNLEIKERFEKMELSNVQVIVTSGDIELYFFNRCIFVYPYWLLKLKMLFK